MLQEKTIEKPTRSKHLWWELFLNFLKIGALTIGGGYVIVPLIEKAIVEKKKWMESEQFLDMLAIAQAAPGVLTINTAVSVGYRIAGFPGAVTATVGVVLPSFVMIIMAAILLIKYQDNPYVAGFFKGVAPSVTILLFIAAVNMGKKAVKDKAGLALLAIGLIGIIGFGVHPILAIIAAGIFGAIYYQ